MNLFFDIINILGFIGIAYLVYGWIFNSCDCCCCCCEHDCKKKDCKKTEAEPAPESETVDQQV